MFLLIALYLSSNSSPRRPTLVRSGTRKSVLEQLKDAQLSSDDDPMLVHATLADIDTDYPVRAGEPEAEEVTDPHFFDGPERYVCVKNHHLSTL